MADDPDRCECSCCQRWREGLRVAMILGIRAHLAVRRGEEVDELAAKYHELADPMISEAFTEAIEAATGGDRESRTH